MGYAVMDADLLACPATDLGMGECLLVFTWSWAGSLRAGCAGGELPAARSTLELQHLPEFEGARFFDIHINLVHLSELAKQQAREREAVE
jgi:hypothetical protein